MVVTTNHHKDKVAIYSTVFKQNLTVISLSESYKVIDYKRFIRRVIQLNVLDTSLKYENC